MIPPPTQVTRTRTQPKTMAGGGHSRKQHYPPCPDGGWGWVIVFGSFMIHVIADGVSYSFGLIYYEIDKHFVESKAVTSMVVSLMNGTTYCIGKHCCCCCCCPCKQTFLSLRSPRTDRQRSHHQVRMSGGDHSRWSVCGPRLLLEHLRHQHLHTLLHAGHLLGCGIWANVRLVMLSLFLKQVPYRFL